MVGSANEQPTVRETETVSAEPSFAGGLRRAAPDLRSFGRCAGRLVVWSYCGGFVARPSAALFDQRVAVWFHQHATRTLTHVAKAITFFGSALGLTILSVAVALVFIVCRAWFNLFLFAVTMTGESLLNVLLKHLFHRHRPVLENPLVTLTSYGFPSGHTMGVTVLFGLLALFLAKTVSTAGAAFAYFIAAGIVILLIGLTRVYLGAHFLSDVLGAFAASVVWLTFCWTAFETLRRRQKHRPE